MKQMLLEVTEHKAKSDQEHEETRALLDGRTVELSKKVQKAETQAQVCSA